MSFSSCQVSCQKTIVKQGWLSNGVLEDATDEFSTGFVAQTSVTLEDFEFLKVVGKGSYGKVILCRERRTQNVCAIKLIQKEVIRAKNEVDHVLTENRVLQRTSHPFLISLMHSFQTPDYLCFVTEFASGGDLFFHLEREHRFAEHRGRFYGAEIISAVGYLHAQGIIYRDIKLENILLDKDGHIKLVDFGLCKEGERAETFCGSPEYLAPEVIRGNDDYGRAVDWWAIGAIMFEMICGHHPFYNSDRRKMHELILRGSVSFPEDVSDESTRDLLKGLLHKDPDHRLGGGPNDVKDIEDHPFFSSINWEDLVNRKIPPPFTPEVASEIDTCYFDAEFTSEPVDM